VKRFIALLLVVTLTISFTAPLVTPSVAYASTGATTMGGLPNIPWAQVWQVVKSWGPMLIYLVDAVLTAAGVLGGGGGAPPNPPPPPPSHNGSVEGTRTLDDVAAAWGLGYRPAAGWA
jgi:hypothetical protein